MLDKARRRVARKNLRLLIEAYLRDESAMRWGSRPAQIRAAAKKMADAGKIPAPLAHRIKERLAQCQKQTA